MVEIPKTVPVSEQGFRFGGTETQFDAERARMVEALRHGSIFEVFAKSTRFKIEDFHQFFANQHRSYMADVIKPTAITAQAGDMPSPGDYPGYKAQLYQKDPAAPADPSTNQQSRQDFANDLLQRMAFEGGTSGGKFKSAAKAQAVDATATDTTGTETGTETDKKGAASLDELVYAAEGTRGEWDKFVSDSYEQIFSAQFMADYKQRSDEVKAEAQRIIAEVKNGHLNPEFALIALAKVNSMQNGVLMSWMGKKLYHQNEEITKVHEQLQQVAASDPGYYSQVTVAQEKTRDGAFQMSLMTTDMQKVMQNVESTLSEVKSITDMMQKARMEIVRRVSASAGG
jgi:hypothetical protein